jgi:hypothetical protein
MGWKNAPTTGDLKSLLRRFDALLAEAALKERLTAALRPQFHRFLA